MPFAASLSILLDTSKAIEEACSQALAQLQGKPDLSLLFFSPHHAEQAESIAKKARQELGGGYLLGCVGEAIVGNDQEVEQLPALSLWLARWSRAVQTTSFHLEVEQTPEGNSLLGSPDEIEEAQVEQSAILLLGDPYSFPVDYFLQQVNNRRPGLRVMGGMASGIQGPNECRLLWNEQVVTEGAVGVLLRGLPGIRSVVSQGCRPIGRHMVITRAEDNVIAELGGKLPLEQLKVLWQEMRPSDRGLIQHGLHVGRVINEYQSDFQRGDFLVRNVLGLDQESGSLAINDRVRVGQTVQFHVRDSETADEDLHELLQVDLSAHEPRPAGALLFTCNGRGTRLFQQPHHDARAIWHEAGSIPLAGFFAQGELGPVGGQNFIHGFTASVVLFED